MARDVEKYLRWIYGSNDLPDKSVWTDIASQYAITVEELEAGAMKAMTSAESAGVTIEEMLEHIAIIAETKGRFGGEAGNSLRNIYRGALRPESAEDLEFLGFRVRKEDNTPCSASDILKDIARKWNKPRSIFADCWKRHRGLKGKLAVLRKMRSFAGTPLLWILDRDVWVWWGIAEKIAGARSATDLIALLDHISTRHDNNEV